LIKLENSLNFAIQLDKKDCLSNYRNLFHIPKDIHNKDLIYFCGNSLGLQPKSTKSFIDKEIKDWANLGVKDGVMQKIHGLNITAILQMKWRTLSEQNH